jgi:hypothetical protein
LGGGGELRGLKNSGINKNGGYWSLVMSRGRIDIINYISTERNE